MSNRSDCRLPITDCQSSTTDLGFAGRVTAGADGAFSFTAEKPWQGPNQNASATDSSGNSSGFTYNLGQFVAFWRLQLPLARR